MKQNKKTLVLMLCVLAALILVCAALALAGREQQNREQEQGTPMIEVHRVDADSITSFTLAGPDETSAFVRESDGWVYNGDPLFPLDHDFVNTALETLSRIDAISLVSEDAEDLSPYGLDQPQMQITMAGEDAELSLRIGNYNSFNGYYYMCEEGVNDVFLIDADLVDLCTATQSDMIRLDRLPDTYGGGEINTVTLTDSQGAQTVYTADSDGFDTLSEQLSSLSLDDYADYFLAEEEYAAWGFDNPVQVLIAYSAEKVSDTDQAVSATVSYEYTVTVGKADEDYVYFLIEESDILYRMKRSALSALCDLI